MRSSTYFPLNAFVLNCEQAAAQDLASIGRSAARQLLNRPLTINVHSYIARFRRIDGLFRPRFQLSSTLTSASSTSSNQQHKTQRSSDWKGAKQARKILSRYRRSTISRITRVNRGPLAPAFDSSPLSSLLFNLKQPTVRKSSTIPAQLASSVVWCGVALVSAGVRGYLATNTAFVQSLRHSSMPWTSVRQQRQAAGLDHRRDSTVQPFLAMSGHGPATAAMTELSPLPTQPLAQVISFRRTSSTPPSTADKRRAGRLAKIRLYGWY